METQVGGGGLGDFSGPDRRGALPTEQALHLTGASRALLGFPGHRQWPHKPISLSLFSHSLGSISGAVLCSMCAGSTGGKLVLLTRQTEARSCASPTSHALHAMNPPGLHWIPVSLRPCVPADEASAGDADALAWPFCAGWDRGQCEDA